MKRVVLYFLPTLLIILACDKVDNPYPEGISSGTLDWSLYPNGDSTDYVANGQWPSFTQNQNTDRNIMIEDYTGHQCIFCPPAADLAKQLEDANPGRVFSAAVHTGPEPYDENWNGVAPGSFQTITPPIYIHNFACDEGLKTGAYFGADWPGSAFIGNPRGTVSRYPDGSNQITLNPNNWTSQVNNLIAANDLKVNIQAASNFYPATSGYFLHTEIEILDANLTNDLNIVVSFLEDSIIKPQKYPGGIDSLNYVHREVFRGCIDGRFLGQKLDDSHKETNGKYYYNYTFKVPSVYNPANCHVLIYVRDAVTEEIYQVIKQHIQ